MKHISSLIFACLCLISWAQPYSDDLAPGGTYYVEVVGTGKVFDISGGSTAAEAQLIQYTNNGGLNQQFRFEAGANGGYKIVAVHSGLVLDVYGGSTQNGARIIQYPYHGGPNQNWMMTGSKSCKIDENGNSTCGNDGYVFYSMNSGRAMTVETNTNNNEARIVQGGSAPSRLRLIRV